MADPMETYGEMWQDLGMNLRAHCALLDAIPKMYQSAYLSQENRPEAMSYFDFVVSEIHGLRIKELMEHKEAGGKVVGTFCLYVPEEIIRAVMSHADHTGIPRLTLMEKALYACDEVTGLVTAVALVRPSRSLMDLEASSVKKKWKDKAFAAGANRQEIEKAAVEFDVELWEHVGNVIHAMRRIAPELGLVGNIPQ